MTSPCSSHCVPRLAKRGFTLVELMVVIAIIGILTALLLVAVSGVTGGVKASRIKIIMTSELGLALEQYKDKYGEYPPDFTDQNAIVRHVTKRWPRYTPLGAGVPVTATIYQKILDDIKAGAAKFNGTQWDFTNKDKARTSALAFWLGGFPASSTGVNTRPGGFHADTSDPFFTNVAVADIPDAPREPMFFEFTEENYRQESGAALTNTAIAIFLHGQPVVYFRGSGSTVERNRQEAYLENDTTRGGVTTKLVHFVFTENDDTTDYGYATPYAINCEVVTSGLVELGTSGSPTKCNITWANPLTFQLIAPGLVNDIFRGADPEVAPPAPPTTPFVVAFKGTGTQAIWENITPLDLDNIVNFGEAATIEGQLP